VLDAGRVDRLGITRLGFTETIVPSGHHATASPYRAPETLDGAPFTVKSDNYTLGVILYQILVGDFHKAMPPGWRDSIEDELLREDLALVAEINPSLRLADAELLAQRLRTLEERRRQLSSYRRLEQTRVRYAGVVVGVAALVIGLAISTGLYFKARRAEESSRAAAAQAEAAAEFLTSEVLTQGSMGTAPELLRRVGDEIDAHFAAQPRIAAELHYLVGHSYARMHDYSSAIAHLSRAIELAQPLDGAGAALVLRSAAELIQIDEAQGHLKDTLPRYEALLAAAQGHVVPGDAAFLELERQVELGRRRLDDLK
jgi:hypothetical protein